MHADPRKRPAKSPPPSESAYRELFKHMTQGLAYCKMVDSNGTAPHVVHLEVNGSFESLAGLKKVIGKKVSEVVPGIQQTDRAVLEIYARVACRGKAEKFEIFIRALHKWFSVSVYSPRKGCFVAIFDDITERKRTEELLRARRRKSRGYWTMPRM